MIYVIYSWRSEKPRDHRGSLKADVGQYWQYCGLQSGPQCRPYVGGSNILGPFSGSSCKKDHSILSFFGTLELIWGPC